MPFYSTLRFWLPIFMTAWTLSSAVGTAAAEQVGVLALYRDTGSMMSKPSGMGSMGKGMGAMDPSKALPVPTDCVVKRVGKVGEATGPLDLPAPNRFLLLSCDGSVLSNERRHATFDSLRDRDSRLVILEGEFQMLNEGAVGPQAVRDREYVIKLSHYNNTDPSGRAQDIRSIDGLVDGVEGAFRNEALLLVSAAEGAARPDEVLLLYYDKPGDGDRFRKKHGDIMKTVGVFNDKHLISFVYLASSASQ